ncbi:hypothetical protein BwSH20_33980 [Bradyrhizobium ottawaense]|nr:hypothetical protein SG09_44150 [Bradyrhizobium ottawaense]BBO13794.1 hypothetical protein TM102_52640 [Bradyrhizobium sp. TM102]GMO17058.1 hypothetical protein BwSF21_08050 [Bradyrhizobium ottawaense]GMO23027.1 hypothetical protein BwSH14_19610 [Bradyrhizobium ottawaense]GMO38480.1 hypothetical protein BwSF12_39250 [Bradyrhizobium ottawaense]
MMARITTSQAVADRNRRVASELAAIGMIREGAGWRASELMSRTKAPVRLPVKPRNASGGRRG